MKKIQLKNKDGKIVGDYIPVHERILELRGNEKYEGWRLVSKNLTPNDPDRAQFKATLYDENGLKVATGHAEERTGSNFINSTSHVENAETSAWGRCLACMGIGIDTGIASYEEVGNAVLNQEELPWMDDKGFNKACYELNRIEPKPEREKYYKDLFKVNRIAKRYKTQLEEIVQQRDINV